MADRGGAAASNGNNNVSTAAASNNDEDAPPSVSELPFLVTHWLANYPEPQEGQPQQEEAMERLRNAASEMASAFSTLGAYGTSSRPSFQSGALQQQTRSNATYGDMRRRWQPVSGNHLESLVQAAAAATTASSESVAGNTNLLLAAQEAPSTDAQGGRRLADGPSETTTSVVPTATSILQTPALLGPSRGEQAAITKTNENEDKVSLSVQSSATRLGEAAGKATREYLSLREEHETADADIQKLKIQVTKQQLLKDRLEKERESILARGNEAAAEHAPRLNRIAEGLLNTDRLIPQHMNSLSKMEEAQRTRTEKLTKAKQLSQSLYTKLSTTMKRFRDPSAPAAVPTVPVRLATSIPRKSSYFLDTITRQYGAGGIPQKRIHGATPSDAAAANTRKAILAKRLDYCMTASAHLQFPVFCLAFDKTGRYFVTGADDCLVKVFYIGAARSNASDQRTFSYGSNDASAILVCTLRGHAGVICDIDISADNAFLATASDDGDCRVWGLKDGAPIAILRGHKDGANMVSWSELMPYRLATTGSDGVSRMWDIREAAINRYGAHVGKRADYTLSSTSNGRSTTGSEPAAAAARAGASSGILASGDELLPPLPLRNGDSSPGGPGVQEIGGAAANNAAGDAGNVAGGDQAAEGDNVQPGQFVRNDMLDEGVRLVTKLQHGAPPDENLPGASTRSRRKAVRVICIARCPKGGHFATGADDGICRVWSEEEGGDIIARHDAEHTADTNESSQRAAGRRSTRVQQQSEGRLLAELTGHVNSITDLQYSNAGDRILTASQKDGVARVWSWTETPADSPGRGRFESIKQILLQVKKPESRVSNRGPSRRVTRGNDVSCDVAIWTADDARILTSQCSLIKEGSSEVVEGSQYVLVWDSRSGQCLLGISAAHNSQVPVLIPHPTIPSLLCSAGGDGVAKLWDLEKGSCLHMHENKVLNIGPGAESNEQQRTHSGYLDGSFSPDGLTLVLTDDCGRFTLFSIARGSSAESDSESSSSLRRSSTSNQSIPSWMKEQYFANDYYELYFDTNGYCVERGSGQPPHLAPRSARCSFTGSPWAEEVNDTFARLVGPVPLSEDACRRSRGEIRYHSLLSETGISTENNRANLVSYFDPLRTVLIDGKSSSVVSVSDSPSGNGTSRQSSHAAGHANEQHGASQRSRSQNVRTLSSNYRWRGYEDVMAEEAARAEEEDADDDDYAPVARPPVMDEYLSDDFVTSESEDDEVETRRVTRRSSRSGRNRRRRRERERNLSYEERSRSRPTRVSARQLNRSQAEHYPAESDDSDAFVEEFLSTNNTPSGPHVEDYTVAGHYFKLPDSGRVRRQWLLRTENTTSHSGVKNYAPQVGDSVVYIPRAHYETIKLFPSIDPPWRKFERGARWPVVRCTIKDVRYRFPYENYYRSQSEARCLSVVAIVTLEVTGIPALSDEGLFSWPSPTFINRQTRSTTFEVSMFESGCEEFIIPEALYTWRLQSIENGAGRTRHQNELPVVAYFTAEDASRLRSRTREDQDMDSFLGTIKRFLPNDTREPDGHLEGSGYETLEVEWDSGDPPSLLSPWEVTLRERANEIPPPPTLSEAATMAVGKALAKVEALPNVEQYFLYPVDESRYSDYRNRVEVPMNFSFIKERVAAGYYSNVRSVLSDAKLIKENCMKYNGPSELSQSASDIYDSFEDEVKRHVDIDDASVPGSVSLLAGEASAVQEEDANDSSRASRLGRRQRQDASAQASRLRNGSEDGGSSLERLPLPEQRPRSSRPTRRSTAAAQNTETSRRVSGRGQELDSAAPTRGTRSGSNRSGLVAGRDARNDSESEDDFAADQDDDEEDIHRTDDSSDDPTDRRASRRTSGRTLSRQSATRRSRRAKSGSAIAADQDDDEEDIHYTDDDSSDDPTDRRASRRTSGRTSRQSTTRRSGRVKSGSTGTAEISSSDEWDQGRNHLSEDEEEESEASTPPPARSSRRSSPRRRATRASAHSSPEGIHTRRSSRAHRNSSMADLDTSYESESESENEESEEEPERNASRRGALKRRSENTPDRPARAKTRTQPLSRGSSIRTSGRSSRGSRPNLSMADLSDSDVNEGYDDSAEEAAPRRAVRRGGASKRARSKSTEPRTSKRTRSQHSDKFPELTPWPEINMKEITKVLKAVLEHFALLDEEGIFAAPVVEQVPDLQGLYLTKIKTPMDFRTIKEERCQYYESIRELQNDLILVFRNCATFNNPTSAYHAFAVTMWEQLNDVFRNACDELGIMLPRRWDKK